MDFNGLKKHLGIRLRKLRQERGLIQEDLEKWGFSYRYYGRLERGSVNPTLETMVKLCEIFEIPLIDLFRFLDTAENVSEDQEEILLMINKVFRDRDAEKVRKLKVFLNDIL
jgi:transcriptional regulator with XRE-family HTH domain